MTQYNFASLPTNVSAIPAKTRTVKKSPLFAKMEKMNVGPDSAFVIEKGKMESVAANVYATAKRIGIKVSLRQLPQGVAVFRVRNTNAQTDTERKNEGVPAKRRTLKKASRKQAA
jgi:hypothetical protein